MDILSQMIGQSNQLEIYKKGVKLSAGEQPVNWIKMSQGLNYSLVCNFEKELFEIQYALDVTIDTNPERGFLNHQKHTSIDKPRVFSHFLCGKCPKCLPAVYG